MDDFWILGNAWPWISWISHHCDHTTATLPTTPQPPHWCGSLPHGSTNSLHQSVELGSSVGNIYWQQPGLHQLLLLLVNLSCEPVSLREPHWAIIDSSSIAKNFKVLLDISWHQLTEVNKSLQRLTKSQSLVWASFPWSATLSDHILLVLLVPLLADWLTVDSWHQLVNRR